MLDPAKNEVRGRETIHYINHSPHTLSYLWLFVEQNICEPNSITNQLNRPPPAFLGTSFDFSCPGLQSRAPARVADDRRQGAEDIVAATGDVKNPEEG